MSLDKLNDRPASSRALSDGPVLCKQQCRYQGTFWQGPSWVAVEAHADGRYLSESHRDEVVNKLKRVRFNVSGRDATSP